MGLDSGRLAKTSFFFLNFFPYFTDFGLRITVGLFVGSFQLLLLHYAVGAVYDSQNTGRNIMCVVVRTTTPIPLRVRRLVSIAAEVGINGSNNKVDYALREILILSSS